MKKTFEIEDTQLTLTFYDTAGQEKFQSITKSYYKGVGACILVYDLTNKESFTDLSKWQKQINENAEAEIPVLVVGNKTDIFQEREITSEEGVQQIRKPHP